MRSANEGGDHVAADAQGFRKGDCGAELAASASSLFGGFAIAQGAAKVVVIGGGPGGATVANQLKQGDPNLEVTLLRPKEPMPPASSPISTSAGSAPRVDCTTTAGSTRRARGADIATGVDAQKKTVALRGGETLPYDRLVLSPGIDIKYATIEGYSSRRRRSCRTRGWRAQTELLKKKLEAMRDGGVVVMAAPNNPYRCRPAPTSARA